MDFETFHSKAWVEHAQDAPGVARTLHDGIRLIRKPEQVVQLGHLVTHVYGEHLGQWEQGISLLMALKNLPGVPFGESSEQALRRLVASLELAGGKRTELEEFSLSDRIRILAVAASALDGQGKTHEGADALVAALDLARQGLPKDDPAHRALAVTGNNLAATLEERPLRSAAETDLMLLAARVARKHWEIAGTWLEVQRAEYRLAMSFLQAGRLQDAFDHAQACLEICRANQARPIEMFFGYEALTLIEQARKNEHGSSLALEAARTLFERLDPAERSWAHKSFDRLGKPLVPPSPGA